MIRTQIYFPYEQITRLRQRALEENTTVSEVLRKIVENDEPKKKNKKLNSSEWLLSLANEAKKLGIKGPKDLSSRVDEFVYGK